MAKDAPRLSPDSTLNNSEMEGVDEHTTHQSSPSRPDPRGPSSFSLSEDMRNTPTAPKRSHAAMSGDEDEGTPSAPAPPTKQARKRKEPGPSQGGNPAIYSGNKVKHLKKDDGEPLWRRDIQYDFLKAIFHDQQKVFTNSYEPDRPKETFADLYIDTMARSSKTSKILKDKLLTEHTPAKNMAMVCLLVNLGRMNTTLNFFPEMRAQLRTYHAIPSLQAHQDPNSYKQLQDAPRLKSILKGASEDRTEPGSLEKIKEIVDPPRTNPVNLIFVLATHAAKVTELHFPPGRDFYDLLMGEDLSSESRARAFLWLMWFYLESDFTEEGAEENPFGEGVDYNTDVRNQGVPRFQHLTDEQQENENVDTQEEKDYGLTKMRERKRIIEADQAAFQAEHHGPPKRGPKPKLHLPPEDGSPATYIGRIRPKYEDAGASPATIIGRMRPKYESDIDSTRSTPPPRVLGGMRIQSVLNNGAKGRGNLRNSIIEGSSPVAHGEPVLRRSRPLTAHQLAVERNRNQRVEYILSRGIRKIHHEAKKGRKSDGPFWRAIQRTNAMPSPFDDSEDEDLWYKHPGPLKEHGFGGLIQLDSEVDDFGEEVSAYAAAFRRMGRRLHRWEYEQKIGRKLGIIGTKRIPLQEAQSPSSMNGLDGDETEDEKPAFAARPFLPPMSQLRQETSMPVEEAQSEQLDDMEKEILGMGSEAEEDLDDVEKAILDLRGDETEEDGSDDSSGE